MADSSNERDTQRAPGEPRGGMDTSSHHIGPMVGAAIILGLLVLGGLYYWGGDLVTPDRNGADMTTSTSTQDENDPAAIESDLNEFDPAEFESQIEADLEAAEDASAQ